LTQSGHHGPATKYVHRKPETDVYVIDLSSWADLYVTLLGVDEMSLKSPSKALGHDAKSYEL